MSEKESKFVLSDQNKEGLKTEQRELEENIERIATSKAEVVGPLVGERELLVRFDDLRYVKDILQGKSLREALSTTVNFQNNAEKMTSEWAEQVDITDWAVDSRNWYRGFVDFVHDLKEEHKSRAEVLSCFREKIIELLNTRSTEWKDIEQIEAFENFKHNHVVPAGLISRQPLTGVGSGVWKLRGKNKSLLEVLQGDTEERRPNLRGEPAGSRLDEEENEILQDFLTNGESLQKEKGNLRKVIRVLSNLFARSEYLVKKSYNIATILNKDFWELKDIDDDLDAGKLFISRRGWRAYRIRETEKDKQKDDRWAIWAYFEADLDGMDREKVEDLMSKLIQGFILIDDSRENKELLFRNALEFFREHPNLSIPIYDSKGFLIWPKTR